MHPIDRILANLLAPRQVEEMTSALKRWGSRAVPRLLLHLREGERPRQTVVFYALQYCWSPSAVDEVAPFLAHGDAELRHMAAIVLVKGEGYGMLAALCQPLLTHPDAEVAAFALGHLEGEWPDGERFLRFFADPRFQPVLWRHLPRYHDPRLTPATRGLLARGGEGFPYAVAGLIQQNDAAKETQDLLVVKLTDQSPLVREMAAEYLTWHADGEAIAPLQASFSQEEDPFARASMEAAMGAIKRRLAVGWQRGDGVVVPSGDYGQTAARLSGDRGCYPEAMALYATRDRHDPHWAFRDRGAPADFALMRESRLALQAELFAIPGRPGADWRGERPLGVLADGLVAPVRDYFKDKRTNYGRLVDNNAVKGFGGMVHVGDDCQWHCPHTTVVAVGRGVVRRVTRTPSWGGLVVIEHQLATSEVFCSLYAHLGSFIHVRPGEVVEKGQKIAVIGRGLCWENGGYDAHLHFSIHRGPYAQCHREGTLIDVRYEGRLHRGRVLRSDPLRTWVAIATWRGILEVHKETSWVVGYLSPQAWQERGHGFVDPVDFLSLRGAVPA